MNREARSGRGKKLFFGAFALVAVFAVVGFLILPPVVKHLVVTKASEALHRQVTVRDVAINPFAMTVSIKGLAISERNDATEFVGFEELFVNLQVESLIRRAPVLREIKLRNPRVRVVRLDERTFNFTDLMRKFSQPAKSEKGAAPDSTPARFSLNNIQIIDGAVELDDRVKQARHALTRFEVAIPFISNLDYHVDNPVQPAVSGVIDGAAFGIKGTTKPFRSTRETTLNIDLAELDLPRYLAFVPFDLGFRLLSAKLSTRLGVSFVQPTEGAPLLRVSGHVGLRQLAIVDQASNPLFALAGLDVEIASSEPLRKQASIASIVLQQPSVHVTRRRDGSLSLQDLAPPSDENDAERAVETSGQTGFAFDLAELRVIAGAVHLVDEVPDEAFRVDIQPVDLRLSKFQLPQKSPALTELSLSTSIGAVLTHSGSFLLSPLTAEGTIAIGNVAFRHFAPYWAGKIRADVPEGSIQLAALYEVASQPEGIDVRLHGLQAAISSLAVQPHGGSARPITLGEFSVAEGDLDLRNRILRLGSVKVFDGAVSARRDGAGAIDLANLIVADQTPPKSIETVPEESPRPWSWEIGNLLVERVRAVFQDDLPAQPVRHTVDPIGVSAEGLSNRAGARGKVSVDLGVNKSGRASLSGVVGLAPLEGSLKAVVQKLNLVPLQPYFTEKLNILLTSGALGVKGNIGLRSVEGSPIRVSFDGDLGVTELVAVDKVASEDFLKWKSLHLSAVRAVSAPFSINVAEVALTDFYSRLIIHPDGHLNVQDILATPTADKDVAKADAAEAEAPPKATSGDQIAQAQPGDRDSRAIAIAKVTLQGGNINFSDRFIKPNYSANLTEMGGSVTGLSSTPGTTATVEMRGSLDRTAPLEINGRINPLVKNLFVDLKAQVRDIELGPLSPYSGKYVGYGIEKGKLFFDVKYFIENRKLQAENRLVVDQLTFGDKVESKDALSLPVKFAISLLKDKDGVIDINLPVSGSLDDPKFSIGGLVWKVIVNLLQKAVTAPFALIGSLFGGGPELSQLEFPAGSATINAEGAKRLEKLTKALTDRPALKLDVIGRTDKAADLEGLRRLKFDRQVKAEKLKDMVKRGESVASVDQVVVDVPEYEKYLTRAYKSAKFPKPRNAIGFPKDLPAAEMEKLMMTNLPGNDDDLIKLANERAQAAKDHLTKIGQIAPERVFLTAPKADSGSGKTTDGPSGDASRVDFVLK